MKPAWYKRDVTAEHALVTGASGFIGLALTRALVARGFVVHALNRGASPALEALASAGQVVAFRGDVADAGTAAQAARGCAIAFHVAAKAGVWGSYADYHRANVVGTERVIDACRAAGVPRLVFTSSPSVAHAGGDIEGLDESAPYPARYAAAYPETKARAERAVLAANGPTLATLAVRPHLVWGPGDTNLTPRILERARRGRLVLVGGGYKRIDATYIDSAVHAHLCALDRLAPGAPCAGRAYFIAQGEPMPLRTLVFGILDAYGLPARARSVPRRLAVALGGAIELGWRALGRAGEPPLTRFVAEQLGTAHWFDLSAARRDLGYAAPVTTAEGLERLRRSAQQ